MERIKADQNLELIPLRLTSAETIFNSINHSRKHLNVWLPFVDQTTNVVDTRNFILSVINSTSTKKDFIYEIWHNNKFAGLIALKELDKHNSKVELGYWLDKRMTGKGIMIKSSRALIEFVFHKLMINRVMIKIATKNMDSLAIPRKLGFTFEGIERDGEFLNGRFLDLKIYSLLMREFE